MAGVLETARLALRELNADDAPFILELLNDPDFLRNIGNRNLRSLDDARGYIETGPAAMIAKHGFGLWLVQRRVDGQSIGMCGLLKRDTLNDVDIGYAFLPAYRGQGYAREAAAATLVQARAVFGLRRVVAIVAPDNEASASLLLQIGMRFDGSIRLGTDTEVLSLYVIDLP